MNSPLSELVERTAWAVEPTPVRALADLVTTVEGSPWPPPNAAELAILEAAAVARDELITASHAYSEAVYRTQEAYDPQEAAQARRDLEAAQARHAAALDGVLFAPEPAPEPAPAPRLLLPIAPRPFAQIAVRHYRMRLDVPFGYAAALLAGNLQWYRSGRRRRPVHQQCPERRREVWAKRLRRAYWHRVAEVMYWGKVA